MENIKTISVEQMRKSDAWTIEHLVSSKELMKRAGDGIFEQMLEHGCKGPVAIICGTGNNAGDGYVVASNLDEAGVDCTIVLAADKFSEDGKFYFDKCLAKNIPVKIYDDGKLKTYSAPVSQTENNQNDEGLDFSSFSTILDCLLGTGFSGKQVRQNIADLIDAINKSDAYVVSADINSGLNGNTGTGEKFVISDLTVSIGFFKHGHFRGQSTTAMKNKVNCNIGIQLIDDQQ